MIPDDLIRVLRRAQTVTVLTGAGISAESGLPTFRDAQTGLWAQYKPEDLATPEAFRRNPKRVWDWYAWRRKLVADAKPNPGHMALVEMEPFFRDFSLITQNVDGLHGCAGSQDVIELHGNISRTKCFEENLVVELWEPSSESPPPCPRCRGPLRPDVVWFNEELPVGPLNRAILAAEGCEVFLSIGTSGLVYPAAGMLNRAQKSGALAVEINPNETAQTANMDIVLRGRAAELLLQIIKRLS